jgi:CheY-like chemotaxis protein
MRQVNTTAPPLVLVVEDEPAIADLLRSYLVRDGFAVEISSGGVAALAAVARRRPAAVILDVGLPGIDGTEVCRRMRSGGDWTPVLFVTARDDEVDRVAEWWTTPRSRWCCSRSRRPGPSRTPLRREAGCWCRCCSG